MGWNGLGVGLANLWRLADGESGRSAGELHGRTVAAGGLPRHRGAVRRCSGPGWKISPSVNVEPGDELHGRHIRFGSHSAHLAHTH
jgi:hypothetical protein